MDRRLTRRNINSHRINERIRADEVRLIDENGDNVGVVSTKEALQMAIDRKLDLVEVSGSANPPVCRIMDYNKFLYEQKSKAKKTKSKKTDLKEFQLGPNTGEGDLQIRIDRGRKFLEAGNVVKYTVKFKGRENLFPEQGLTKLKIVESELSDISRVDQPPKKLGSIMSMVLTPLGNKG